MKGIWIALVSVLVVGCTAERSHLRVINGEKLLSGPIGKEELFREFPQFKENYDNYMPRISPNQSLRETIDSCKILIFLGTWCSDTKRHLPVILKVIDFLAGHNVIYELHALDRSKRDSDGLTTKYRVERIPTVIFIKHGSEVGRFVERPKNSVEDDLYGILAEIR
ncbi:MAG: thioredoxin family protein [Bacteroidetes bacterium]|nr:thioredoxin family protein [Bacteroidota bacterium]